MKHMFWQQRDGVLARPHHLPACAAHKAHIYGHSATGLLWHRLTLVDFSSLMQLPSIPFCFYVDPTFRQPFLIFPVPL